MHSTLNEEGENTILEPKNQEIIPLINQEQKGQKKIVKVIFSALIGGILSIISVLIGISSQQLQKKKNINIPVLITTTYYILLFFTWIIINKKIVKPKWFYLLLALFDSQGNFVNIYVFSLVKIEVPYIINFSSVIWIVLLSYCFKKKLKYSKKQYFGILISIIGIIIALIGTVKNLSDFTELFRNSQGLLCCLITSILYAISTILMEIFLLDNQSIYDFFPWLGLIGAIITFGESFITNELIDIIQKKYIFDYSSVLLWVASSSSLLIFCTISPFYINNFSAASYNISLATTVFWSYIADIILDEEHFSLKTILYFIGFFIILGGVVIFNSFNKNQ